MIINTKNLLLKTFSKSLVNQDYYNWFNDHDVKKYIDDFQKSTNPQLSLKLATDLMAKKYDIYHTTIQVEDHSNDDTCKQNLH